MTRMTGQDCAVMRNLVNTHTHTHTGQDQCERHRMTWMTGPDCAVMCNLINVYTHKHTHNTNRHTENDLDDRVGLHGYVQFNTYTQRTTRAQKLAELGVLECRPA